jgi:hypothetical protein
VIFFLKAPANWDFMEDPPTPGIAEHVWQQAKTPQNTLPNSRPAPSEATRQRLAELAGVVIQLRIINSL